MHLQTLIKEVYETKILDSLDLNHSISFAGRLKIDRRYNVLDLLDLLYLIVPIHHYIMINLWELISIRNH